MPHFSAHVLVLTSENSILSTEMGQEGKTLNQWESKHDLNNLWPGLNILRPCDTEETGSWQISENKVYDMICGRLDWDLSNWKCLPCLCTFYGLSPVFYVKWKCFNCSRNRKNKQICGITDNFLLLGITNFN